MLRDRGVKRRTITADLGADGQSKLDALVKALNVGRYYRKETRSSALRRAVAMYHAYLVAGVMPAPLGGDSEG